MQHIRDHQDPHQIHTSDRPLPPSEAGTQEQGSIKMNLVNSELWKAFHTSGTEMVITKYGRRMFPHCNISLSGLDPFTNYVLMMDMVPVDQFKYKWNKEEWEVAGKAEPQPPLHTYVHPDSPALGAHWMKQPVSFLKAKLTNNTLDQHGHIILHSMHRYSPRFTVVQADSAYTVRWSPYQTFSFPETSFTTVTAYQNTKITKLKIDHNPFAKGFREGGHHYHGKRCHRSQTSKSAEETTQLDRDTECKSPSGIQGSLWAMKSEKRRRTSGHSSSWLDQESESLHTDVLDLSGPGHGGEEQMVPASMAYQAHSLAEYRPPSPHSDASHRLRSYEAHVPDVVSLPVHHHHQHHPSSPDMIHQHHPSSPDMIHQHHPSSPDMSHHHPIRDMSHQHPSAHHHPPVPSQEAWPNTVDSAASVPAKASPGLRPGYPLYRPGPYPGDRQGAEPGRQFMVNFVHPSPAAAFHPAAPHQSAHPHGYHGNMVEWSQYPLFSYSGW